MLKRVPEQHYFLGYLTANDDPTFFFDYLNIKNIARYHPGVASIHVCISVSLVRKINDTDVIRIKQLKKALLKASHVADVNIIYKNNIGRDFSSAQKCLEYFSKFCTENDYVMIRNRSGYGPFSDDWYKAFIKANQKLEEGGLTGSTINQAGLHNNEVKGIQTHIQTYVYISRWKYFRPLVDEYPGSKGQSKNDVIINGEIELSRSFLDRGLALNCLEWRSYVFTSKRYSYSELPDRDIKKRTTTDLPIRFRYRRYLYRFRSIIDGIRWDFSEYYRLVFVKKFNHMREKL